MNRISSLVFAGLLLASGNAFAQQLTEVPRTITVNQGAVNFADGRALAEGQSGPVRAGEQIVITGNATISGAQCRVAVPATTYTVPTELTCVLTQVGTEGVRPGAGPGSSLSAKAWAGIAAGIVAVAVIANEANDDPSSP